MKKPKRLKNLPVSPRIHAIVKLRAKRRNMLQTGYTEQLLESAIRSEDAALSAK